jgi:hypothetical protein
MTETVPRKRVGEFLKVPTHIMLHALLFVCVLSLRDVIKATLDRIPIPNTNIAWLWLQALIQIAIGFGIISVLAYYGWVDHRSFING